MATKKITYLVFDFDQTYHAASPDGPITIPNGRNNKGIPVPKLFPTYTMPHESLKKWVEKTIDDMDILYQKLQKLMAINILEWVQKKEKEGFTIQILFNSNNYKIVIETFANRFMKPLQGYLDFDKSCLRERKTGKIDFIKGLLKNPQTKNVIYFDDDWDHYIGPLREVEAIDKRLNAVLTVNSLPIMFSWYLVNLDHEKKQKLENFMNFAINGCFMTTKRLRKKYFGYRKTTSNKGLGEELEKY